MKIFSRYLLLFSAAMLLASCGSKTDDEKLIKLEELKESLTEYYEQLEEQGNISENYDSMKILLDSLYDTKYLYSEKIDSVIEDFKMLKEDAKRLRHEYFPSKAEDIAEDIKEMRMKLEEGLNWIEEQTDSLDSQIYE